MIGGSSGGLLVADAVEELDDRAPGTVQTVVTLSSPTDFASALAYWTALGGPTAQLHLKDLTGTLGCTLTEHEHVKTYTCPTGLETQYSPDLQVTPESCAPQWLIFNSADEVQPTSQATAMDAALQAQGCAQRLTIVPGTAHAFDYWSTELAAIQLAVAAS